ncbi:MAG: alpha-L-glutamate ligase-like protein [Pseudomonadales bacterium]|nr:alpha-L-glutamate ligase-like protein [Pseudomonadales bacterium]
MGNNKPPQLKQKPGARFKLPWTRLREKGVLGMNQRNGDFIMPYNERRFYPLVDDKRATKKAAITKGIPVPELYGNIEIDQQIEGFEQLVAGRDEFVIKPANGSGGNGIVVIAGKNPSGLYRKANETLVSKDELHYHLSNILSGMYSLGGSNDAAIIEYRVQFDNVFQTVSYRGVPDIRTIVFRGIPIMAMLRLPTRTSDGRANLHQGAIGAGIDIETGQTTRGVFRNEIVTTHPDTGADIKGLTIPHWQRILEMAAQCHEIAHLDYLGVDIVLDKEKGPMMLELNARPGLNIQLCNGHGLLPLLKKVAKLNSIPPLVEQRVRLGKEISNSTHQELFV